MNHHRTTGPGRPAAKRRGARPGTAMVLIAGGMTLLMASAVWVVDLAAGLAARTADQAATDAAALAGVQELIPPYTAAKGDAAKAKAVEFAALNGLTITTDDVAIWDHPAGGKAITVYGTEAVDTFFAKVFAIQSMAVAVNSSAANGAVTTMPSGTIPFGVPAYESGNSFAAMTGVDPEAYTHLPNPPDGSTIAITLKVNSGNNNSGNFLALSLDGRGANEYRDDIINGCDTEVSIGDYVDTQTGNMVGPTSQGIAERVNQVVTVPLVDKAEWDENKGRSQIHVIGFASVKIQAVANNGIVTGIYQGLSANAKGTVGGTGSAGVTAPVLIETP